DERWEDHGENGVSSEHRQPCWAPAFLILGVQQGCAPEGWRTRGTGRFLLPAARCPTCENGSARKRGLRRITLERTASILERTASTSERNRDGRGEPLGHPIWRPFLLLVAPAGQRRSAHLGVVVTSSRRRRPLLRRRGPRSRRRTPARSALSPRRYSSRRYQ